MHPTVDRFSYSPEREPHRSRTKELLENHPDVRRHIGKNPQTFWIILAGVSLQVGVGVLVKGAPWWVIVAAAFFVGAFASHALWVMIHECAHNLIFTKSWLNTLAGILANSPHLLPSSVSFQRYHLKHHAFQGVYELDADLPNVWEARLIGHSPLGKAIWLLLFPIFQVTRPPRLREIRMFDRWIVLNMMIQVAFDVAIWVVLGPKALAYLALSFFFSVGLHPLGARWIQEHYLVAPPQETYSYYGPLNTVAFNVGYHNEHHDLPSVPWNHLPAIRAEAPEMYDSLVWHNSWTKLLLRFLLDPNLNLFSRVVRVERGAIPREMENRPEAEILSNVEFREKASPPVLTPQPGGSRVL
ncbi:MAG TPA: fatty acid desaturase [Bryobacteraceae bacterium]|jgi:sphingolipid delta-4 desaturase